MRTILRSAVVVLIVSSGLTYAHESRHPRTTKFENGLVVSWDGVSSDVSSNQINISDEKKTTIVDINVLECVPDASRVSIYDVAMRGNVIAVAAVFQSKKGNKQVRPTSSLMLFDAKGRLASAFALAPSYAIRRLALDEQGNIWTLTDHADINVDPSTVPMLVEYSAEGTIEKQLLPRSQFPFHASDTKEDVKIGAPVMGYSSGIVWFWLPGSTDMVTMTTSDGKASMTKTHMPSSTAQLQVLLGIVREPSGNMVAQVREYDNPRIDGRTVYYTWSPSSGSWSQFTVDQCDGASALIGADDNGEVYMNYNKRTGPEICRFHTK